MKKTIVDSEKDVIETLCSDIEILANDSIRDKGVFRIGLSGGSLVKYLSTGLPSINTNWSKWKIFFCDERYVPDNDPDSTYGAYKSSLLPKIPLLQENQFIIIDTTLPLTKCADDYENKIRKEFHDDIIESSNHGGNKIPEFDLLLLGMGPDGHTCSLFPGHSLLKETSKLISSIDDSPKPPSKRITMTFPLINNAKCCMFAISGSNKSDMVKRIFVDKEQLPAGMVSPRIGYLHCIFDKESGIHLQEKEEKMEKI